jgi:hypothetical protein
VAKLGVEIMQKIKGYANRKIPREICDKEGKRKKPKNFRALVDRGSWNKRTNVVYQTSASKIYGAMTQSSIGI